MKTKSAKIGLPPGSLVYIGEDRSEKVRINVIHYDEQNLTEDEIKKPENCSEFINSPPVTWFNVDGIYDSEIIKKIGEVFGLHMLLLEDVMNSTHRPKLEEYENCIFLTLKMLSLQDNKKIAIEQVSIVLGHDWVISFQEQKGDIFEPIRERIRLKKGQVRSRNSDYLIYLLLDSVVDNYYLVTEYLERQVEQLEEDILRGHTENIIEKIQSLKKELIIIRKAILPLKDEIRMIHSDYNFIEEQTLKYFNDLNDQTKQVIDTLDSLRDLLSSLLDIYHSTLSSRMNEVMKTLTIVATIFIPLTFVAGIYGMNFNPEAGSTNMPELNWKYGYLTIWGVMLLVFLGMLLYFRKKKWL